MCTTTVRNCTSGKYVYQQYTNIYVQELKQIVMGRVIQNIPFNETILGRMWLLNQSQDSQCVHRWIKQIHDVWIATDRGINTMSSTEYTDDIRAPFY